MDHDGARREEASDLRTVSATRVREMLASLQEAVVTNDQQVRRGLVKDVVAKLQEVLAGKVSD